MIRWLRDDFWGVLWPGLLRPYRLKTAWINVGSWAFALALVVLAAVAEVITERWLWLIWLGAVGIFDLVMLHRSLEGLLWRWSLDRWQEPENK